MDKPVFLSLVISEFYRSSRFFVSGHRNILQARSGLAYLPSINKNLYCLTVFGFLACQYALQQVFILINFNQDCCIFILNMQEFCF